MASPITVDIWSDIACPWCFIGKRRFEEGLAGFAGRNDVEVTYRSYELAPDTPVDFEGAEIDFLVRHKGMPAAQVEGMLEQVRHVGRPAEIADLAAEVGLDRDAVPAALESGDHADAVAADIEQARAHGISGVPFFVFNGRYGVSGAQPAETFTRVLEKVHAD